VAWPWPLCLPEGGLERLTKGRNWSRRISHDPERIRAANGMDRRVTRNDGAAGPDSHQVALIVGAGDALGGAIALHRLCRPRSDRSGRPDAALVSTTSTPTQAKAGSNACHIAMATTHGDKPLSEHRRDDKATAISEPKPYGHK